MGERKKPTFREEEEEVALSFWSGEGVIGRA